MPKSFWQKKKSDEHGKCVKCKERNATKEDQMCDNCRFLLIIENILETSK